MYKPKVYTASKINYQKLWLSLREDPDWDFVDWTASWVESVYLQAEIDSGLVTDEMFREAWTQNVYDIRKSDFLLIYSRAGEALKGALVEAGVALGNGIDVIAVGLPTEHNWCYYPSVRVIPSLREARQYLYRFTAMIPKRVKGRVSDEQQE